LEQIRATLANASGLGKSIMPPGFFSSLFGSSNKQESVDLNSKETKKIYFEKTDFEPVVLNRFIVNIDGIPSYIICGARMPHCTFYRNKERKTVEERMDEIEDQKFSWAEPRQ